MLYNVYVSTRGDILVEFVKLFVYIFVGPKVNFRCDGVDPLLLLPFIAH